MDGGDLTPAARRRVEPEPRAAEVAPASGDDGVRMAALETAVRAIDVRLEYLERLVSNGFQEAASRSVVLAEATDEVLTRIETAVAEPTVAPAPEPVDLSPFDVKIDAIRQRLDDLAVAVVALQPTIDAIVDLRSTVELVGGRLAELLGGPSLTEIMDRLDEIDQGLRRDER